MNFPLVAVTLADLKRAQWLVVMFNLLHRFVCSFMWSGFLLELGIEIGSRIMAIWVHKELRCFQ